MTDRTGAPAVMPEDQEPLPCPWCPEPPRVEEYPDVGTWEVGCQNHEGCFATVLVNGSTRAEAITRWNTRAPTLASVRGILAPESNSWRKLAKEAVRFLNREQLEQASKAAGWTGHFCGGDFERDAALTEGK